LLVACALFAAVRTAASAPPRGFEIPVQARQLLVVTSPDWTSPTARLQRWRRTDGGWIAVGGLVPVRLGRTGLGWGRGLDPASGRTPGEPVKREGDERAPAGVFELGPAFGELPRYTDGTRLSLRVTTRALRCVDDPASALYNQLTESPSGYESAEVMARGDLQYSIGVFVAHNPAPLRPGAGSCIFLHVWAAPESATVGCTAMAIEAMAQLVGWLDERERPLLVQLPDEVYRARREAWKLP